MSKFKSKKSINPLVVLLVVGLVVSLVAVILLQGSDSISGKITYSGIKATMSKTFLTKPASSLSPSLLLMKLLAIKAGGYHTCMLTVSGSLYCWGNNEQGQLGDGTTTTRYLPIKVPLSSVKSFALGKIHTCAITSAGTYCWGNNSVGQLGDGTTDTRTSPTKNSMVGATQLAAGSQHTCAINGLGDTYCWGNNPRGELGLGYHSNEIPFPKLIPTKSSMVGATQITAGSQHTCAINSTGAYCWGVNDNAQLGKLGQECPNPNYNYVSPSICKANYIPVQISNEKTGGRLTSIEAGSFFTCGINEKKETFCWGANDGGQLGDGVSVQNYGYGTLLPRKSNMTDAIKLFTGSSSSHICAINLTGAYCWGNNLNEQIPDGTQIPGSLSQSIDKIRRPTKIRLFAKTQLSDVDLKPIGTLTQVAVGATHTCVISFSETYCVGLGATGALGLGPSPSTFTRNLTRVILPG